MASILAVCYVSGKAALLHQLIHTMYKGAFQYGASIYISCAAVFLSGTLCDIEDAESIGRCVRTGAAGMKLLERFKSSPLTTGSMRARIGAPFWALCGPWGQHWRDAVPEQERIGIEAVNDGEFEYAGYCVWHAAAMRFFSGEPLQSLSRWCSETIRVALRHGRSNQVTLAVYTHQLVLGLIGARSFDEPYEVAGALQTTEQAVQQLMDQNVYLFAHFLLHLQLQARYYSGDYAAGMALLDRCKLTRPGGHVYAAMELFFRALTILRAVH